MTPVYVTLVVANEEVVEDQFLLPVRGAERRRPRAQNLEAGGERAGGPSEPIREAKRRRNL
jgi:hypothetical protein